MINLITLCENAETIGISAHIKPDGDAVGSTQALRTFLKRVFPNKRIDVRMEKPADVFSDIPGVSEILTFPAAGETRNETHAPKEDMIYDVYFIVDTTPVAARVGEAISYFENARQKVNVDHHVSNPGIGDYLYIVPEASSACELVYNLIHQADPNGMYMDRDLAQTIYTGMVTDTGVFQFSNTNPSTLRVAADLIEYGFDFSALIDHVFYEKTIEQNHALGIALMDCKFALDGDFCYIIYTQEDMKRIGVGQNDFESVANMLRYTKGVKSSALIRQMPKGDFKVSLRSSGHVDVSKVAEAFNGGGHTRASGCNLPDVSEGTMQRLFACVEANTTEELLV
ncbi:MAG: bifunctional oligoribonuclease/PAP phosphatase NrnA [Lachnospiraceae bacterium]|nr:bifunctional oligoribonuclease/PAP phosphatase NrnA [Lachnospiraceae bacterium]